MSYHFDHSAFIINIPEVERWLPVPGLSGVEVSSEGKVRGNRAKSPQPCLSAGYPAIYHNGVQHHIHRLVCRTFHGEAPKGRNRALHWDDDPFNNRADNLRWGSARENAQDAKRNGIAIGPNAWASR